MIRARAQELRGLRREVNRALNKLRIERTWPKKVAQTPKHLRPRCGARTRRGTACVRLPVWDPTRNQPRNGRCPNHGGLSTGPRTPEGKARSLEKLRLVWERRRAEKAGSLARTLVLLSILTLSVFGVAA
jgi:hypothetical protein